MSPAESMPAAYCIAARDIACASEVWLDAEALPGGDLAKVGRKLQEGLASAEHAAFIAKLSGAMPTGQ